MFEYIEKLRHKTDKEKKRFAFITASSFSIAILVVWSISIYPTIKKQSELDKKVAKVESGPTESFTSTFGGAWGDLKSSFSNLKGMVANISSEFEYYSATSTATTTPEAGFVFSTTTVETKEEQVYGGL